MPNAGEWMLDNHDRESAISGARISLPKDRNINSFHASSFLYRGALEKISVSAVPCALHVEI
jgi:hypothetical protein